MQVYIALITDISDRTAKLSILEHIGIMLWDVMTMMLAFILKLAKEYLPFS